MSLKTPDANATYWGDATNQVRSSQKNSGLTWAEEEQKALKSKTSDSLYKKAAKKIGITNFNSWDDVKKVETYLAGGAKGGSGSGGGTGSSSSGSSGSSDSKSGQGSNSGGGSGGNSSAGGNLNAQAKQGQSTSAGYKDDTSDLSELLTELTMGNQASAQALTDMMNMQAMTSSLHMAGQQQQMQLMAMGMQAQIQASQQQAMLQFAMMDKQQKQMMAAQAEQARIAENLGRARVPEVAKTAGVTPVGDYRKGNEERDASRLSELRDMSFLPSSYTGADPLKNSLVLA